jgi:hypothetical protein
MLVIALAALAIAPGQDTLHYRFESVNEQNIDASAAGQGVIEQTMTVAGRLSVFVSDTTDGRIAAVIVDTATVESSNPMMPAGMFKIPGGTAFRLHVVEGRIIGGLEPNFSAPGSMLAMGVITSLFAPIKAGVAAGDSWTDTVVVDTTMAGAQTSGRTITAWRVIAVDGEMMTIEARDEGNASGGMGSQAMMNTVTHGTRRFETDRRGPVSRLEMTSEGDIQMEMGANGAMAMTQKSRMMLERVP